MMADASLLRLLQLASPSLPIGAFSYSQGLETAIDRGCVHDALSAGVWIHAALNEVVAPFDAPLQWRLLLAFAERDEAAVACWSERWLASRDTAELRAETIQMGYSLRQLILALVEDLPGTDPRILLLLDAAELSLPTAYACAATMLRVAPHAALLGALFSWVENQVLVCVKTVPLGQTAGQKTLLGLAPAVEAVALRAQLLPDYALSSWTPGLSLLSMQHEVQYSRLYRS